MSDEEVKWYDDGHVLHVTLVSGGPVRLRVECADRERCEAKFGCHECYGTGRTYGESDDESDCPHCDGTGIDEASTKERCCLVEWMDLSAITDECMDGPDVELTVAPAPVVWRSAGSMEDWEPFWKVKADAPVG